MAMTLAYVTPAFTAPTFSAAAHVSRGMPPVMSETATAPPPKPSRPAEWNPKGLKVPSLPGPAELFGKQFVPQYLEKAPAYLDGSMRGDVAFDPWALTVL